MWCVRSIAISIVSPVSFGLSLSRAEPIDPSFFTLPMLDWRARLLLESMPQFHTQLALIRSGGGIRPAEARQPPSSPAQARLGNGANSAGLLEGCPNGRL